MIDVDKYKERLKALKLFDEEVAHWEGDQVLCELLKELGYSEIVTMWDDLDKRYS